MWRKKTTKKREFQENVRDRLAQADRAVVKSEKDLESSRKLNQLIEDGANWLARLNQENNFSIRLEAAYLDQARQRGLR